MEKVQNGIDIAERLVENEKGKNTEELLNTLSSQGYEFIKEWSIDLIEKFFSKYADQLRMIKYLDNFDFNVQQSLGVNRALLYEKAAMNDKLHKEIISEEEMKDHSEKYLNMNLKGFREEVVKEIEECGIDIEALKKEYGMEKELKAKGMYRERREDIYKKIRPVYISLRRQGYTNQELIT